MKDAVTKIKTIKIKVQILKDFDFSKQIEYKISFVIKIIMFTKNNF